MPVAYTCGSTVRSAPARGFPVQRRVHPESFTHRPCLPAPSLGCQPGPAPPASAGRPRRPAGRRHRGQLPSNCCRYCCAPAWRVRKSRPHRSLRRGNPAFQAGDRSSNLLGGVPCCLQAHWSLGAPGALRPFPSAYAGSSKRSLTPILNAPTVCVQWTTVPKTVMV